MNIADLGLAAEQIALLEMVYRMVGRRDAGWKFDPAKIPVHVMQPLIGDYIEWLRTQDRDTKEEEQKCLDLFNQLLIKEAA